MRRFTCFSTLLSLAFPVAAAAQTGAVQHRAVEGITAGDVRTRIGIIADDSMLGRNTPSRGLELTAQYVADQFKAFGLRPGGENGTWFQRYPLLTKRLDLAASSVRVVAGAERATAVLSTDAVLIYGLAPEGPATGPARIIGGVPDPSSIATAEVPGQIVLFVIDFTKPRPPSVNQTLTVIEKANPRAIVLVSNRPSPMFEQRVRNQGGVRVDRAGAQADAVPVVEVRAATIAGALAAAGVDLDAIRASAGMVDRVIPGATVTLDLKEQVLDRASAPNTIGILEGTDPVLRREYVVFSAHMDHIGITPGQPDSINNGADDDGSGTAGVMELAEAFSRARPKRSMIFLTVSGEEKGLWGSEYFTSHPTVPLTQIVADINIDMIGRNWPDTIVAIGKEHSDLGATLNRVNAAHRELGMTAIDDRWPEENFYFRSDHYNFARRGVPILFFFNGVHADYHQVTDSPEKINAEKESRILKLLFFLGQDIANAPDRPKWNPASYKLIVDGAK